MRTILRNHSILLVVIILALLIRVIGVMPGLNQYHPDEPILYGTAIKMIINGDLNPHRFDYPDGSHMIHYFVFSSLLLPIALVKLFLSTPESAIQFFLDRKEFLTIYQAMIFGKSNLDALFWSRYTTAILGTLSVFLTYYLGKIVFDKKTGLFAAFFLAVNYRHVFASHLSLPEIPNTLFLLVTLIACFFLLKENSRKNYLFAGIALGLYFSTKYQVFPLVTFLLVHSYLAYKNKNWLYLVNKNIFITAISMIGVFAILNMYFFLDFKQALSEINWVSRKYQVGIKSFNFYPLYYLYYWGITALPFVAIILGMVLALRRHLFRSLFLFATILPFLFVMLYYVGGGTYVRNFTTIMPLLMIFAGFLFSFLFSLFKKQTIAKLLIIALFFFVNVEPIKNSLVLSLNYTKAWNREVLINWVGKHLPFDAIIANDNVGLEYDRKTIVRWEIQEDNSIAELRDMNADFAVGNVFWHYNLFYWWFGLPPGDLIKQDMPYTFLDNTHQGLAQSEFLDNVVFEVYKPWQAPEFNYFIVKIPPLPKDVGKQLALFDFSEGIEDYKAIDVIDFEFGNMFRWDGSEGNKKRGSLQYIGAKNGRPTTRIVFQPIAVTSGKLYTVNGYVKVNKKLEKRDRDGFLRIDFFADSQQDAQSLGGMKKAVSSRIYERDDWVEVELSAVAPENATFMTVSFQRVHPDRAYDVWMDDIRIYEGEPPKEVYPDIPYIKSTMPKNLLYPNSFM